MEHINSFNKGLNKDIAKHQYPNDAYYHLENFRLALGDNTETGALANVEGNKLISGVSFSIPGLEGGRSLVWNIIGHSCVREDIYLFVTVRLESGLLTGAVHSAIFKIDIDGETQTAVTTLIWHDYGLADKLNLSTNYPIRKSIGNPETTNIHNIYWTDYYNPFRKLNVKRTDLLNYQGTELPMPPSLFDIVPDSTLVQPAIANIFSGGSLTAGMVQYAYSLYNINGAETKFSPASNLIHLVESSDYQATSELYQGSEIGTNTGKAVEILITSPDTNYTNIRVVSIHYSELYTDPTISIIAEVKRGEVNTIIDDGADYLGTYTVDEFTALGGTLFTCKDFETKDNRIFASNLKEQYFDVEFDARAYRFNGGQYTRINKIDWENANSEVIQALTANTPKTLSGEEIPETHDCINPSNELQGNQQYKTKWNSSVLGGDGKHVSYEFITKQLVVDNSTDQANKLYTDAINKSYGGYDSPYSNDNKGYPRDEIYAFGLVFINKKGTPSFVKWIGDIRFPDNNYLSIVSFDSINNTLNANILGISFTIDIPQDIQTDIQGFHIVRCKREANDRTVVMQGIIAKLLQRAGVATSELYLPVLSAPAPGIPVYNSESLGSVYEFISPEICFNRTNIIKNSLVELNGYYIGAYIPDPTYGDTFHAKYYGISTIPTSLYSTVEDTKISTTGTPGTEIIGGETYNNTFSAFPYTSKGTSAILTLEDYLLTYQGGYSSTSLPIPGFASIRRDVIPYTGNTYSDRTNREYFSVKYVPIEDYNPNVGIEVYNGDTYIVMFDYLRGMRAEDTGGNTYSLKIPVETSVNLYLRHDSNPAKIQNADNHHWLQEIKNRGTEIFGDSYPEEFTDLYLYNSVYSRENDLVKFFPKPLDWVEEVTFDCDTIYSEVKYNGEGIDNWTKFLPNSRNTAASQYGPINKIILHNNNLLFFQDSAIGVWYTNVKEIVSTNNPGALAVGSGEILSRYDYITTKSGTKHQFSVLGTDEALYYLDAYNGTLNVFNQNPIALSVEKGIASFVKKSFSNSLIDNPIINNNYGVTATYDKEHGECLFTFRNGGGYSYTLVFSEPMKAFTGIYTVAPRLWILAPNMLLSVPESLDKLYQHNVGNYGEWYDVLFDSTVTLLVNPAGGKTCMFNKHSFNSECSTNNKTFSEIECMTANTMQESELTPLVIDENLIKRFGTWRLNIPRDVNEIPIRDNHLYSILNFKNTDNEKFVVYPITTYFQPAPF